MTPQNVPNVTFKTRIRNDAIAGDNPFEWKDLSSDEIFKGKRVVVFSLPGAFTPTCSTYQLPDFERLFPDYQAAGIDAIYCISVNDAFVMNQWGKSQNVDNIGLIPDGNGHFTQAMGMLVEKENLGFGKRSWRYAAIVDDGTVTHWFEEPGREENCETDPYGQSSPQNVLESITGVKAA